MVLLNIGLFDILHTTIPYSSSVCLLRFSMFMTKLDIWSNVNVLNCEISAECLVVTTLRFDFWIRVQVHRLNGIHRRVTRLCIIVRSALAAWCWSEVVFQFCEGHLTPRNPRCQDKSRFHGIIWREIGHAYLLHPARTVITLTAQVDPLPTTRVFSTPQAFRCPFR